jgi:hypothetical protein
MAKLLFNIRPTYGLPLQPYYIEKGNNMEHKNNKIKYMVILFVLSLVVSLNLSGCTPEKKQYHTAEIYLNCENYSTAQNDPGNCQVVPGTTSGLRIAEGMIVTKEYVNDLMSNLGWKLVSRTQKYVDVNGVSYRIDVLKFSRVLN